MSALRLASLVVMFCLACQVDGGSDQEDATVQQDAGPRDADVDSPDVARGEPPDMAVPTCEPAAGETFDLDPDGPDTQIHAALVPAPGGAWAVYNRPDPGGGFDVWATRVGCDGSMVVPPFQVNEDAEFNDVDPALARNGDRVLFAWATDDGMGPHNLSVRLRAFDDAGVAVGPERRLAIDANAWMVKVAATEDGFLLVGSLGDDELNAFQLFALAIDRDGMPVGEPSRVAMAPESQSNPALVVAEGAAVVAWTEGSQDTETVRLGRGTIADGFEVEEAFDAPVAGASVTTDWIASTQTARGMVLARPLAGGDPVEVGASGKIDHSPGLATGDEVTAIAWYRVIRGIRNELWYTRLGSDRTPTQVETDGPVAPYGVALTPLGARHFALAWSEGDSPDFRLRWRIIRL